jgi:hypothetical protein
MPPVVWRVVMPPEVVMVGADDPSFWLTPPPSPIDTGASDPPVKSEVRLPLDLSLAKPVERGKATSAVAGGLAEWRRSAPFWEKLPMFLAAVALAPRWTSSYNNMCFYFAYQAVTLADCVPRDWQNSMCAPPLPMRSIHASSPGVLCMCLRQQREGEDG